MEHEQDLRGLAAKITKANEEPTEELRRAARDRVIRDHARKGVVHLGLYFGLPGMAVLLVAVEALFTLPPAITTGPLATWVPIGAGMAGLGAWVAGAKLVFAFNDRRIERRVRRRAAARNSESPTTMGDDKGRAATRDGENRAAADATADAPSSDPTVGAPAESAKPATVEGHEAGARPNVPGRPSASAPASHVRAETTHAVMSPLSLKKALADRGAAAGSTRPSVSDRSAGPKVSLVKEQSERLR